MTHVISVAQPSRRHQPQRRQQARLQQVRVSGGSTDMLNGSRSDEILAAATEIFAQRGYPNTDVQLVADAVGLGKGTIYRAFGSKRELFLAAADRGMRLLNEAVNAASDRCDDPLEQIAEAVRAYLEFFARHPEQVELLIQERAEFRDRPKPTYFVYRDANVGRWKRVYRKLISDGRIRRVPVERITDVMSGLVYGTMFINFFTGRKKSSAAQADEILEVVFNGILTPQGRATMKRSSKGSS
jgi:AcrR family transcriptional regulator